jgi:predicted solute-binding protein
MDSLHRIGGLSYLNTRPLVFGIEDRIVPGEPAAMADAMRRGELDAAIVPVAEVLREDRYDVVDGIAIASRGPVFSVFLRHQVPAEKLQRVRLDPASRTSVWLLRVLLKCRYGVEPEFGPAGGEAELMIGDRAVEYRLRNGAEPVLDLGAAWTEWTGLPFVYAVWAVQKGARSAPLKMLREAKAAGLAHLEEIAQRPGPGTPEFRLEYLSRYVVYDLGAEEKRGLRRFQELCAELGLVKDAHELRYIS